MPIQPFDPENLPDGPSEYCWGSGLFPPGVAENLYQEPDQPDFGQEYSNQGLASIYPPDGLAIMTAQKRTDTLDPNAVPNFREEGNMDRYGRNPKLIQEPPQENAPWWNAFEIIPLPTPRKP